MSSRAGGACVHAGRRCGMRAIALVLLVGGCGAAAAPSLVASVDYGSRSSPSVSGGFGVPSHESATGDLVVRPDGLALHFALAGAGPDAERAQAAAKEKIEQ